MQIIEGWLVRSGRITTSGLFRSLQLLGKGFMQACSYKGHEDLRIGSNFSSSFKFLFSSPFSTEKSAPVFAWKVMIFISK
jgi:hypothetical protein